MSSHFQYLRSALLNWYPFAPGNRALLAGENTQPLMPLLKKHFQTVDTAPAEGERYDCIAAADYAEKAEDLPALLRSLCRLLDDGGAARGVRAVCGLCAALRVAALAAGLLG